MRRFLIAVMLCAATVPGFAQVSVSIGQPGFYGRIDLGDAPRPQLIHPQPVVIRPAAPAVSPIYLHVPVEHSRNWGNYCGRYNACSQPVYFVQSRWYNDVYVPHYQKAHPGKGWAKGHDKAAAKGHGKGHGKGRDD